MGCAYALTPLILLVVPIGLLTNLLTLSETNLVKGFWNLAFLWTAVLLFFQVQVQHGMDGMRSVWAAAIMLFACALVVFAAILGYALTDQVIRFVVQVFLELTIKR